MRRRFASWVLASIAAGAAGQGCADGTLVGLSVASSGSGGSSSTSSTGGGGGMGSTSMMTAASSSSASSNSSSTGAGGMSLCGNGKIDPGETCDGMDFGGVTCQSLGLGAGMLACTASCHIAVSGCGLPDCLDPSQSCLDPYCAGKPGCVDSCMPALTAMVPGVVSGDTEGRPMTHAASCSSAMPGSDEIFQVTPAVSGYMSLSISGATAPLSISVRTACADDTSEIACSNKATTMMSGDVTLGVKVMMGQTYYVMVQGMTTADQAKFSLSLAMAPPETACTNFVDDDMNGYTDCDDPNCQATSSACTPGSNGIGQPCTQHDQCVASSGTNNPFCFDQAHENYPNGYCSHFCDPANPGDCGESGICVPSGPGGANVCMLTCSTSAQCRTGDGYTCQSLGYPEMICTF